MQGDARTAWIQVNAAAPTLVAVKSRRVHGALGNLDLPVTPSLALDALTLPIEPRNVSNITLVFQFSAAVTGVGGVAVVDAASASLGTPVVSYAGQEVIVTLPTIAEGTRARVTLGTVNGAASGAFASIGWLPGDINASRAVNAADIAAIKARISATISALNSNARYDLNGDGVINNADVAIAKARAGVSVR